MNKNSFRILVAIVALAFTGLFFGMVVPPLIEHFDVIAAFAAGFVNPYAAGYSSDVIACWLILAIWIFYERSSLHIQHGWICLVLGVVPGVAVGFACYLLLRLHQLDRPA